MTKACHQTLFKSPSSACVYSAGSLFAVHSGRLFLVQIELMSLVRSIPGKLIPVVNQTFLIWSQIGFAKFYFVLLIKLICIEPSVFRNEVVGLEFIFHFFVIKRHI